MQSLLKVISPYVPVPSIFPLRTFFPRLLKKWIYMIWYFKIRIGLALGITGGKIVGFSPEGNCILQLNRDGYLGNKKTNLHLPKDKVIFWHVRYLEEWELDESKFIASHLSQFETSEVALLDIGANTGLVTLQALNLVSRDIKTYLFEPVMRHAEAIKNNLQNFKNIEVFQSALSDRNEVSAIYTESTNHANSSIFISAVPASNLLSSKINLVETTSFMIQNVRPFANYVIKCDTQGMDALILSRLPDYIWQNTVAAVVEIWALKEVKEDDVDNLMKKWSKFTRISLSSDFSSQLTIEEVRLFWLGKTGAQVNLYLK